MKLLPVILLLQVMGTSWVPGQKSLLVAGADIFVRPRANEVQLCMMNCGQCKEMYGDYFDGRRCAEFCLVREGSQLPDCNVPDTVVEFLKSLLDYGPQQMSAPLPLKAIDTKYHHHHQREGRSAIKGKRLTDQANGKPSLWYWSRNPQPAF